MQLMDLLKIELSCTHHHKLLRLFSVGLLLNSVDVLRQVLFLNNILFFLSENIKLFRCILKPRMT